MIPALTSTPSTPRLSAPRPAAAQETPSGDVDTVSLSDSQPTKKSSWLGGKLARAALVAGLSAAALGAFTAPAMAHDWGYPGHHHHRPAVTRSVDQFGINIDSRGNVGVYVGSQSYDPHTGVMQRGGISIGSHGVGIDYGISGPGIYGPSTMPMPGGCQPPVYTMPLPGGCHPRHPGHHGPRVQQNQQVIINGPVILNNHRGW